MPLPQHLLRTLTHTRLDHTKNKKNEEKKKKPTKPPHEKKIKKINPHPPEKKQKKKKQKKKKKKKKNVSVCRSHFENKMNSQETRKVPEISVTSNRDGLSCSVSLSKICRS